MLRLAVGVEHEYGWQHKVGHKTVEHEYGWQHKVGQSNMRLAVAVEHEYGSCIPPEKGNGILCLANPPHNIFVY